MRMLRFAGPSASLLLSSVLAAAFPVTAWAQSGIPSNTPSPITRSALSGILAGKLDTTSGDASAVVVKPTGGVVNRVLGDVAAELGSVFGYASSGTADWTSAINTALASGHPARLPLSGSPYNVAGTITLGANQTLQCDPGVQIVQTTPGRQTFSTTGAHTAIRDCVLSGGGIGIVNQPYFSWIGGGDDSGGGVFFNTTNANHILIERTAFTKGTGTALTFQNGANDFTVRDSEFENNTGFGVFITLGASHGNVMGNWTNGNGIELVGITYDSSDVNVQGNRAKGTGDNCYSFTGYRITVTGNLAYGCAYNGFHAYGTDVVLSGNVALDNGQVHNPSFTTTVGPNSVAGNSYSSGNANSYAGFEAYGGYGGPGQNNTFSGNFADDDQTTPTQAYDYNVGAGYSAWAASTAVASGTYTYANGGIYKYTAAGTTGTTAPSFTSGSAADGTATAAFLRAMPIATREAAGNIFVGNRSFRYGTAAYSDTTVNHNNTICYETGCNFYAATGITTGPFAVIGGRAKKASSWVSGTTYTYGQLAYANAGNRTYRQVSPNGPCVATVTPANTSGAVATADGCTWLAVVFGNTVTQEDVTDGGFIDYQPINLGVLDTTGATVSVFAGTGTPAGKVTAPAGSLYLRSDGAASTTFYVKESGTGTAGWVAK